MKKTRLTVQAAMIMVVAIVAALFTGCKKDEILLEKYPTEAKVQTVNTLKAKNSDAQSSQTDISFMSYHTEDQQEDQIAKLVSNLPPSESVAASIARQLIPSGDSIGTFLFDRYMTLTVTAEATTLKSSNSDEPIVVYVEETIEYTFKKDVYWDTITKTYVDTLILQKEMIYPLHVSGYENHAVDTNVSTLCLSVADELYADDNENAVIALSDLKTLMTSSDFSALMEAASMIDYRDSLKKVLPSEKITVPYSITVILKDVDDQESLGSFTAEYSFEFTGTKGLLFYHVNFTGLTENTLVYNLINDKLSIIEYSVETEAEAITKLTALISELNSDSYKAQVKPMAREDNLTAIQTTQPSENVTADYSYSVTLKAEDNSDVQTSTVSYSFSWAGEMTEKTYSVSYSGIDATTYPGFDSYIAGLANYQITAYTDDEAKTTFAAYVTNSLASSNAISNGEAIVASDKADALALIEPGNYETYTIPWNGLLVDETGTTIQTTSVSGYSYTLEGTATRKQRTISVNVSDFEGYPSIQSFLSSDYFVTSANLYPSEISDWLNKRLAIIQGSMYATQFSEYSATDNAAACALKDVSENVTLTYPNVKLTCETYTVSHNYGTFNHKGTAAVYDASTSVSSSEVYAAINAKINANTVTHVRLKNFDLFSNNYTGKDFLDVMIKEWEDAGLTVLFDNVYLSYGPSFAELSTLDGWLARNISFSDVNITSTNDIMVKTIMETYGVSANVTNMSFSTSAYLNFTGYDHVTGSTDQTAPAGAVNIVYLDAVNTFLTSGHQVSSSSGALESFGVITMAQMGFIDYASNTALNWTDTGRIAYDATTGDVTLDTQITSPPPAANGWKLYATAVTGVTH